MILGFGLILSFVSSWGVIIMIGLVCLAIWGAVGSSSDNKVTHNSTTVYNKPKSTPVYTAPKKIYSPPVNTKRTVTEVKKPTLSITQKLDKAIREGRNVSISYSNYNGEYSKRVLSDIRYNDEFEGYHKQHIKAFCHKRNEERTFKIERIVKLDII
jgi:hypothetical protein